jgi:L-amino acid N-acyltransferase YncA
MTPLSFQVEPFSAMLEEARPLLVRHWEELALDKDAVALAPDWQRYANLEAMGALSVVTVRENGKLVGYSWMVIERGLHYRDTLEAYMDIYWIAPEVRGRYGGVRLFRAHERELKRRGVKRVHAGSKLHRDSSRLFRALDYTPVELWFSKMLTED